MPAQQYLNHARQLQAQSLTECLAGGQQLAFGALGNPSAPIVTNISCAVRS